MKVKTTPRKKEFPKIYDLVDKNDKFVKRGTREEAKKLGLWWRVAHVFIFNARREILACKRPSFSKSYPSLITSSAGGKVEAGETYLSAARRELREELGITSSLKLVGRYDVRSKKHGKVIHQLFTAYAEKLRPNPHEISVAKFVPIKKLLRDTRLHPKRYALPFLEALALYSEKKIKNPPNKGGTICSVGINVVNEFL